MLKKRLALLCELIEGGGPLCDVGTDHGLLPIFLVKEGRVPLESGQPAAAALD